MQTGPLWTRPVFSKNARTPSKTRTAFALPRRPATLCCGPEFLWVGATVQRCWYTSYECVVEHVLGGSASSSCCFFFTDLTQFECINNILIKVNFLGRTQKLVYFGTEGWTASWTTNPWTEPGQDHFCKNLTIPSKAVRSTSLLVIERPGPKLRASFFERWFPLAIPSLFENKGIGELTRLFTLT